MEASLAEPEGSIGFHAIKGDPGAATVENMLSLADRLAFIKKLDLPRDMLTGAGKPWIDQIVRRSAAKRLRRCAATLRGGSWVSMQSS